MKKNGLNEYIIPPSNTVLGHGNEKACKRVFINYLFVPDPTTLTNGRNKICMLTEVIGPPCFRGLSAPDPIFSIIDSDPSSS
jgi:hypothetical protein